MDFFRKQARFALLAAVLAFTALSAAEGFLHHHETAQSGCSYCQWHKDSSTAPTPVVPTLFTGFLLAVFFFTPLTFAIPTLSFPSGRSPPQNP